MKNNIIFFMKGYILIIVIIILGIPGISQTIANSKWKSVFLVPHAVDVILDFKKDTLYISIEMDERMGTLTFSHRNDTLMITKISGASPCSEQSTGLYRIEWLEDGKKFLLRGISDECEGRIGTFTTNPYERIPEKQ